MLLLEAKIMSHKTLQTITIGNFAFQFFGALGALFTLVVAATKGINFSLSDGYVLGAAACYFLSLGGRYADWYFGLKVKAAEKLKTAESGVLVSNVQQDFTPEAWGGRWGGQLYYFTEASFDTLEGCNFRFSIQDGTLLVSLNLFDQQGNLIAQLDRNEWVLNRGHYFQRNYTKNALEVIDNKNSVVLQLLIEGRIVDLQFKLFTSAGRCVAVMNIDGNGAFRPTLWKPTTPEAIAAMPEIPRMFRYPSEKHFGEMLFTHKRSWLWYVIRYLQKVVPTR